MKVSKKQQQAFNPITIEITFETEREYKLFKQFLGSHSDYQFALEANSSAMVGVIENFTPQEASATIGAIYIQL